MDAVTKLLNGGAPAWKFENYGDTHTGVITEFSAQQQTDFDDGSPKVFANGDPMMQIVIDVDTQQRLDAEDDGKRRVYVKSNMLKALSKACRDAGVKSIEAGGQLTVTYVGDGERSGGKKGNPPKLYAVQYVPPATAQAAAVLGVQQPVGQFVQPPAQHDHGQAVQPTYAQQVQAPQPVQQYAQPAHIHPVAPAQPATVPAHPYPTQAPAAPVQAPPVQQAAPVGVAAPLTPGTPEWESMANSLRRLGVSEDEIQQRLAAGQ